MLKKMYLIPFSIITILLAINSSVSATIDTTQKIDSTIVITADLNGDGKDDSIFCHITGESWKKPFTVSYKIVCNDTVILSETSANDAIDPEFGNPSMMDWCEGYVPCKNEWYFKLLPEEVIRVFKPGDKKRKSLLDTTYSMSLVFFTRQYYIDSLGYSKKKANSEIKKLISFFEKKDIVCLQIPAMPVYKSFPRFYDPIHKKMIQLYGY